MPEKHVPVEFYSDFSSRIGTPIVHTDTLKCIQTNTMWSVINTLKHIMIYYNVISPYATAAADCCPVKYEQYCIIRRCILNFCFVLLEYNNNEDYCYYPPDGNAFGLPRSVSHDTYNIYLIYLCIPFVNVKVLY